MIFVVFRNKFSLCLAGKCLSNYFTVLTMDSVNSFEDDKIICKKEGKQLGRRFVGTNKSTAVKIVKKITNSNTFVPKIPQTASPNQHKFQGVIVVNRTLIIIKSSLMVDKILKVCI